MFEKLEVIDRNILLFINSHHTEFIDSFMWIISSSTFWIPSYIIILYFLIKKYSFKKAGLILLMTIASVGASDYISSSLIKKTIKRYRPTHNLEIKNQIHVYKNPTNDEEYRGGQYGFVSSHAANFFAMAFFLGRFVKTGKRKNLIFEFLLIACLVGYSRVYLGVHYPSDILGGAIIGTTISLLMYQIYLKWFDKYFQ